MQIMRALFFALAIPGWILPSLALGQSAGLIEAARKEGGRVVVYGSLQDNSMEPIGKAFRAKTGLELTYWRGTATKVMDRALVEHRAGKALYDVVLTSDNEMEILQKEGIFQRYDSPANKAFPPNTANPELGPVYRYTIVGVVYNKDIVKPADAPKTLEDILKPQFRGRIAMPDPTQDTSTLRWLESLHKVMGKERATQFIADLAAAKPMMAEAFLVAADRASTGEAALAITLLINVVTFGQKGAPMDYVRLPAMIGNTHHVTLSRKAPHSNAGKAFIDFFLGEESMKILARNGESVNRKGVYPPIPEIDKVKLLDMENFDAKGFAEKRKEYQKIFAR